MDLLDLATKMKYADIENQLAVILPAFI